MIGKNYVACLEKFKEAVNLVLEKTDIHSTKYQLLRVKVKPLEPSLSQVKDRMDYERKTVDIFKSNFHTNWSIWWFFISIFEHVIEYK